MDFMETYMGRVIKLFPQYGDRLLHGDGSLVAPSSVGGGATPEIVENLTERSLGRRGITGEID